MTRTARRLSSDFVRTVTVLVLLMAASAAAGAGDKDSLKAEASNTLQGAWEIELVPLYGQPKGTTRSDLLRFEQDTVSADALAAEGYRPTEATISVGDDGVAVWETLQTSEGRGVALWRGELHGNAMRGILSKHPVQSPPQDFSFSGKKIGSAPLPPAPLPAAEQPPPAEPPKDSPS